MLVGVLKIVRLMEWTSSNINANSAARSLSGSAGATRTSANLVTRNSVAAIMYPEKLETSCRNVRARTSVR